MGQRFSVHKILNVFVSGVECEAEAQAEVVFISQHALALVAEAELVSTNC